MARFVRFLTLLLTVLLATGCGPSGGRLDSVWGHRGQQPGDFIRPRAITVSQGATDELVIIDFTGRLQIFDVDGTYLRGWSTPSIVNGRPAGVSIGKNGNILVADSHYNRVLVYTPAGELVQELVGQDGEGPGPFAYVSEALQDAEGNYYIIEFGDSDRIRKHGPDGKYLTHWGGHGSEPGQLARPRGACIGRDGLIYVADSCNHRIQVFDRDGKHVRSFGSEGTELGQLRYPYDVALGKDGDLYVAEFGNHRVQRFTARGEPRGVWGGPGREPGRLNSPWGLSVDSRGRVHVADTENHRIQRLEL
jgi:DNA-binding beta-propeller fold protein YncE